MNHFVLLALAATLGTWLVTALGAATVVFFTSPSPKALNLMLGFASGVMIAASFWSLLQPAIERAEALASLPAYFVATAGFLFGAVFMWVSDKAVTFATGRANCPQGARGDRLNRIIMLVLSITLHNIPEGLAVGVAFGALQNGCTSESFMGAVSVAVGIGLQNFPEGAAVSLPMRSQGVGRWKAFACGAASGIVEPIFGLLTVLVAGSITGVMPWVLAFAAGAMIYVVVEELIPEAQLGEHSHTGTVSVMLGFLVMMLLDVVLG